MSRKRSEIKSKKSYKNYSKIILIIIILVVLIVMAVSHLPSDGNNESEEQNNESDGKWLFALDTYIAQVGSMEQYSTGYIPTLVIININGDIIHRDSGVHTKAQLMDYVNIAQNPSSSQSLGSAPDFTLQTFDGGTFKLSENIGKVVILDFMAVRCPPCAQQMPELYKLKKELGNSIVILSIDVDAAYGYETEEQVRNAYEEYIHD